jgi:hypothetical protein
VHVIVARCAQNPEIGELAIALVVDKDIRGFYIAMAQLPLVQRVQSERQLPRGAHHHVDGQRAALIDMVLQRAAIHVFERKHDGALLKVGAEEIDKRGRELPDLDQRLELLGHLVALALFVHANHFEGDNGQRGNVQGEMHRRARAPAEYPKHDKVRRPNRPLARVVGRAVLGIALVEKRSSTGAIGPRQV